MVAPPAPASDARPARAASDSNALASAQTSIALIVGPVLHPHARRGLGLRSGLSLEPRTPPRPGRLPRPLQLPTPAPGAQRVAARSAPCRTEQRGWGLQLGGCSATPRGRSSTRRRLDDLLDEVAPLRGRGAPSGPREPGPSRRRLRPGEHRLLCGNPTDASDLERLPGGEETPLLWSPPYGVGNEGKTAARLTLRNARADGGCGGRARQSAPRRSRCFRPCASANVLHPAGPLSATFLCLQGH